MKTNYEIRYAAHPEDAKGYDTQRIRRDFLMEKVFSDNEVNMVYSMYDRMIVGGARPVGEVLKLEAIDPLKAPYFLTRREMGIFNVGGPGVVKAGDAVFELDYKEALYLGSGDREVTFESKDVKNPAKFYFNSVTAHRNYPDKKVPEVQIPPLLFVSFVENAFKHGVSYRSESFIHVLMQLDEGNRLSFRCSNSNNGSADEQHHGIGLENIRKRLRLLFGNDYTLSITEEEHKFDVLLIIPLLE